MLNDILLIIGDDVLMEKNFVIIILPNGEYFIEEASETNSRHWCCFEEIEKTAEMMSDESNARK